MIANEGNVIMVTYGKCNGARLILVQLLQHMLAAMTPLSVAQVDQSPLLSHTFNDVWTGGLGCIALCMHIVGLPIHAGQCWLEGAGNIQ